VVRKHRTLPDCLDDLFRYRTIAFGRSILRFGQLNLLGRDFLQRTIDLWGIAGLDRLKDYHSIMTLRTDRPVCIFDQELAGDAVAFRSQTMKYSDAVFLFDGHHRDNQDRSGAFFRRGWLESIASHYGGASADGQWLIPTSAPVAGSPTRAVFARWGAFARPDRFDSCTLYHFSAHR